VVVKSSVSVVAEQLGDAIMSLIAIELELASLPIASDDFVTKILVRNVMHANAIIKSAVMIMKSFGFDHSRLSQVL